LWQTGGKEFSKIQIQLFGEKYEMRNIQMKSNSAINKVAPNSPLNIKLREIHDIKQAINNSHMPEDIKKAMMSTCDSQMNQAWRWHYARRPGYEIIIPRPSNKIKAIMSKTYGLDVWENDGHIYGQDESMIMMVVAPHDRMVDWMLRVSNITTFDRWANSTVVEQFFASPKDAVTYLSENVTHIYKQLLNSLSREVEEEREASGNNEN
jgi:hypothetical protein